MPKYQYLLFDADGTLLDYEKAESTALQQALAEAQLPFDTDILYAYQNINKKVWLDYEKGILDKDTLKIRRFEQLFKYMGRTADARKFSVTYTDQLSQCADLLPGAYELLTSLSGTFHLSIVTNGIAQVQYPRLEKSNILPMIKDVFVSEEVGYQKPETAFFNHVFDQLSIDKKTEVMIIGDSLSADIMGGLNAGIDTCWYNPDNRINETDIIPTHEINKYHQLTAILDN